MSRAITGLYEFGPFRLDLGRQGPHAPTPGVVVAAEDIRPACAPGAEPGACILETGADERTVARHLCRRGQPLLSNLRASQSARRGWGTVGGNGTEARLSVRCGGAGDHAVRRVVGRAGRQREERTVLGDAGARHQEDVAGRRDSHGGLARGRHISHGRCASRARRRSGLRPPCRSLRTRDTSGRRASRPTEAGSPFPGTARRWATTTSTSNWPVPANPCA